MYLNLKIENSRERRTTQPGVNREKRKSSRQTWGVADPRN
jgi:hypothetical protein